MSKVDHIMTTMKHLLFFILLSVFNTLEAINTMGPVGKIIVNSIYPCDEKVQMEGIDLNLAVKTTDSKGTKVLHGNMTNKFPIDESMLYEAEIKKWEGSKWKDQLLHKGKLCDDVKKFVPNMWKKLLNSMEPAVKDNCPINADTYTVEKYQADSKDFNIPSIFYGRMYVKFIVIKEGKTIICVIGEGESQAPKGPK